MNRAKIKLILEQAYPNNTFTSTANYDLVKKYLDTITLYSLSVRVPAITIARIFCTKEKKVIHEILKENNFIFSAQKMNKNEVEDFHALKNDYYFKSAILNSVIQSEEDIKKIDEYDLFTLKEVMIHENQPILILKSFLPKDDEELENKYTKQIATNLDKFLYTRFI